MKTLLSILICISVISGTACAQSVGIGTISPHPSAGLEVSDTARGILIPRMTTSAMAAIAAPAKGLMVYDSTANILMVNTGTYLTPEWRPVTASSTWNLTGNAGTNSADHFIGTTDNTPLYLRVNNQMAGKLDSAFQSTYFGYRAGRIQSGFANVAIGYKGLYNCTSGDNNIAIGSNALFSNTSGDYNMALGSFAMHLNTTGYYNTGIGFISLYNNTTGAHNIALGPWTLLENLTGSRNIAVGYDALKSNTTGQNNSAIGYQSMSFNSTGSNNTAMGYYAYRQCSTGHNNAAFGDQALALNYAGSGNTAIGSSALFTSGTASFNTALGYNAGKLHLLGWNNTFIGAECNANGNGIFNSVALGNATQVTASNQVRIGNTSTTSIGGYTNWSNISDGRYKRNVREDVSGLAFILKLRPVTYQLDVNGLRTYLGEPQQGLLDSGMEEAIAQKAQIVQSGFIAQEVEKAAKQLGFAFSGVDAPKSNSDLYALRYAEFVVPLVKAVQEQQVQIAALVEETKALRSELTRLTKARLND